MTEPSVPPLPPLAPLDEAALDSALRRALPASSASPEAADDGPQFTAQVMQRLKVQRGLDAQLALAQLQTRQRRLARWRRSSLVGGGLGVVLAAALATLFSGGSASLPAQALHPAAAATVLALAAVALLCWVAPD